MINPADYPPVTYVFVYPVDGGPTLRAMRFATYEGAEIQQSLFVQQEFERRGIDEHQQQYGDTDEDELIRGETLILRVPHASLNIQQIILELVCGKSHGFGTMPEAEKEVLIERLLPDYDQSMYRMLLEAQWDELDCPEYPHEIRAESDSTASFPPYSVRTENDDYVEGGFRTFDEAEAYAREQQGFHPSESMTLPPLYYIQNGHENTIHTVDVDDYRDYD